MEYILVTNRDCHWYVIPLDKEDDWCDWRKSSVGEGEPPIYATKIGESVYFSPSSITFENFKIRR